MNKQPLVSIIIPNYHHEIYLKQCLDSAFSQTYPNIEVIFLDNCSSDNSVNVAKKYLNKGLRICRNIYNIFNYSYRILSDALADGDYMMLLPADDYILPDFVSKCIEVMEKYPNVGYVHTERDFVTEDGELLESDYFYNCSFIASGREVMPIYMMTTVAHPAQGIFRKSVFEKIKGYHKFIEHSNADKTLWFYLSSECDYAYIREKLARIRIGRQTETSITQKNFQHPILSVLTIFDFVCFAETRGYKEVIDRKKKALNKLVVEFLGDCEKMLLSGQYDLVKKYLTFCELISEDILTNEVYTKFMNMVQSETIDHEYIYNLRKASKQKKRNYLPPDHYQEIFL